MDRDFLLRGPHENQPGEMGGQNQATGIWAGFGPCCHLPGQPVLGLLTHSQIGCGSKLNSRGCAGFGPCFPLTRVPFWNGQTAGFGPCFPLTRASHSGIPVF